MSKAKLDRSRSFGEVIGLVDDGVRYKQDGKEFNAQENEIGPKASPPVSSENSGTTPSNPVKQKKRKRRTKAQMAAARDGKPREIFQ